MIPESFHEFFLATAGAAGALTGLIFVAVSVFPERLRQAEGGLDFQIGAARTLLVFSNALVLSLVGLVPGTSLGWWAIAVSVAGLIYCAATGRLIVTAVRRSEAHWRSFRQIAGLVSIFGFELAAGIRLAGDSGSVGGLRTLDYVLIADLLMGIFTAGSLVGLRDTGWISSLRFLARGEEKSS